MADEEVVEWRVDDYLMRVKLVNGEPTEAYESQTNGATWVRLMFSELTVLTAFRAGMNTRGGKHNDT